MKTQQAMDRGDAVALRRVLEELPAGANALIVWGPGDKNRTHPLHYVSDKIFDQTISEDRGLELIEVLLAAGSDVNHKQNETALHGAASLSAERVGLRLIEAGAQVEVLGAQGETALHWAAYCGLPKLVERILTVSEEQGIQLKDMRDAHYSATPLEWARQGRKQSWAKPEHDAVIAMLEDAR